MQAVAWYVERMQLNRCGAVELVKVAGRMVTARSDLAQVWRGTVLGYAGRRSYWFVLRGRSTTLGAGDETGKDSLELD
jgi:hypothetical protein